MRSRSGTKGAFTIIISGTGRYLFIVIEIETVIYCNFGGSMRGVHRGSLDPVQALSTSQT